MWNYATFLYFLSLLHHLIIWWNNFLQTGFASVTVKVNNRRKNSKTVIAFYKTSLEIFNEFSFSVFLLKFEWNKNWNLHKKLFFLLNIQNAMICTKVVRIWPTWSNQFANIWSPEMLLSGRAVGLAFFIFLTLFSKFASSSEWKQKMVQENKIVIQLMFLAFQKIYNDRIELFIPTKEVYRVISNATDHLTLPAY